MGLPPVDRVQNGTITFPRLPLEDRRSGTYGHKRPLQTVRGLRDEGFSPAWLLVAIRFQHKPTPGVVQLLVPALTTDRRVLCGAAGHLDVRVIAAQRRQRVPDVRLVWLRMGSHSELRTGSDAVSMAHASHPLTLKCPWN